MHDTEQRKARAPTGWLRNARGAPRWGLLIAAAVVVLAVGLVAGIWGTSSSSNGASAHAADRPPPATNDCCTQGFDVYNHSVQDVTFDDWTTGNGATLGAPPNNTVIPPGGSLHFEMTENFNQTDVTLNFTFTGGGPDESFSFDVENKVWWTMNAWVGTSSPAGHNIEAAYPSLNIY